MKAFVRETDKLDSTPIQSVAIDARLEHIEQLMSEMHDWVRAEQIATLPDAYRHLYTHLVGCDFERRFAAQIVRRVWQDHGTRHASADDLLDSTSTEIQSHLKTHAESLPNIRTLRKDDRPYVLALVGSSGAGKTTLMYKLAVRATLNYGLRVKIVSSDTYKIGSVEGVQTIADILNIPYGVAFEPYEISDLISDSQADLVILDTAGRSDPRSRSELSAFLAAANPDETHLILSATMGQRALQETAALFLGETISCITFTKVDEAPSLGAMLSAIAWMDLPLGYISNGTTIPDDILPSTSVPLGQWAVRGVPIPELDMEAQHV